MEEIVKKDLKSIMNRFIVLVKWLIFSIGAGIIIGIVGAVFAKCITFATSYRTEHENIILLLPLAGVAIIYMYHIVGEANNKGTNMVISAIQAEDEITIKTAPLIFISTVITHLFGGSSGREGAALQLGGSIGNFFGRIIRLDEKDKKIFIMCGMSAAFSALFGTPMAAAIFSMEVVSVGVMYYAALVPCVFSSIVASRVAASFGIEAERFVVTSVPALDIENTIKIVILAVFVAGVSMFFCIVLHKTEEYYRKIISNKYIRIATAGAIIVVLTLVLGTTDYLGAGMNIVEESISGIVKPEAFIMKMVFTALTLGAGYKGGEIVPSFFVGATFGCLFGQIVGISPSVCAAAGLVGVFCGVTNCPITSILISIELFGLEGLSFYLIVIAISYMQSGYYGLYKSQKIMYSKVRTEYINVKTRE